MATILTDDEARAERMLAHPGDRDLYLRMRAQDGSVENGVRWIGVGSYCRWIVAVLGLAEACRVFELEAGERRTMLRVLLRRTTVRRFDPYAATAALCLLSPTLDRARLREILLLQIDDEHGAPMWSVPNQKRLLMSTIPAPQLDRLLEREEGDRHV